MKNDSELSRDGDTCFLKADFFGQLKSPSFQGRERDGSRQHRRSCLVEVFSGHFIAVLRDASVPTDLSQLISARCQTGIRPSTGRALEAIGVIEGRCYRKRDYGANPWRAHEQSNSSIGFRRSKHLPVEIFDPIRAALALARAIVYIAVVGDTSRSPARSLQAGDKASNGFTEQYAESAQEASYLVLDFDAGTHKNFTSS